MIICFKCQSQRVDARDDCGDESCPLNLPCDVEEKAAAYIPFQDDGDPSYLLFG